MQDPIYQRVSAWLRPRKSAAIAFSGGGDSSFLLAAARDILEGRVIALTVVTPYMARKEITDALAFTADLGVRHELIELAMPGSIADNPPDRCYWCKRALYERLTETASALGFPIVLDGTNLDDLKDYRPGIRALHELDIQTPLVDCEVRKEDIRRLSRELGLPTWRKPTNACLLTRLPFGRRFSMHTLQRVEEAERILVELGFDWVRVRVHGAVARIEVATEQRSLLLEQANTIVSAFKALGFRHVALDLEGYRLGSMNEPMT